MLSDSEEGDAAGELATRAFLETGAPPAKPSPDVRARQLNNGMGVLDQEVLRNAKSQYVFRISWMENGDLIVEKFTTAEFDKITPKPLQIEHCTRVTVKIEKQVATIEMFYDSSDSKRFTCKTTDAQGRKLNNVMVVYNENGWFDKSTSNENYPKITWTWKAGAVEAGAAAAEKSPTARERNAAAAAEKQAQKARDLQNGNAQEKKSRNERAARRGAGGAAGAAGVAAPVAVEREALIIEYETSANEGSKRMRKWTIENREVDGVPMFHVQCSVRSLGGGARNLQVDTILNHWTAEIVLHHFREDKVKMYLPTTNVSYPITDKDLNEHYNSDKLQEWLSQNAQSIRERERARQMLDGSVIWKPTNASGEIYTMNYTVDNKSVYIFTAVHRETEKKSHDNESAARRSGKWEIECHNSGAGNHGFYVKRWFVEDGEWKPDDAFDGTIRPILYTGTQFFFGFYFPNVGYYHFCESDMKSFRVWLQSVAQNTVKVGYEGEIDGIQVKHPLAGWTVDEIARDPAEIAPVPKPKPSSLGRDWLKREIGKLFGTNPNEEEREERNEQANDDGEDTIDELFALDFETNHTNHTNHKIKWCMHTPNNGNSEIKITEEKITSETTVDGVEAAGGATTTTVTTFTGFVYRDSPPNSMRFLFYIGSAAAQHYLINHLSSADEDMSNFETKLLKAVEGGILNNGVVGDFKVFAIPGYIDDLMREVNKLTKEAAEQVEVDKTLKEILNDVIANVEATAVEVSEFQSQMGSDAWTFKSTVRAGESECALDIVIEQKDWRRFVNIQTYTKTDLKLVHCKQTKGEEVVIWNVYLFLERGGKEIERYDMPMSEIKYHEFDVFLRTNCSLKVHDFAVQDADANGRCETAYAWHDEQLDTLFEVMQDKYNEQEARKRLNEGGGEDGGENGGGDGGENGAPLPDANEREGADEVEDTDAEGYYLVGPYIEIAENNAEWANMKYFSEFMVWAMRAGYRHDFLVPKRFREGKCSPLQNSARVSLTKYNDALNDFVGRDDNNEWRKWAKKAASEVNVDNFEKITGCKKVFFRSKPSNIRLQEQIVLPAASDRNYLAKTHLRWFTWRYIMLESPNSQPQGNSNENNENFAICVRCLEKDGRKFYRQLVKILPEDATGKNAAGKRPETGDLDDLQESESKKPRTPRKHAQSETPAAADAEAAAAAAAEKEEADAIIKKFLAEDDQDEIENEIRDFLKKQAEKAKAGESGGSKDRMEFEYQTTTKYTLDGEIDSLRYRLFTFEIKEIDATKRFHVTDTLTTKEADGTTTRSQETTELYGDVISTRLKLYMGRLALSLKLWDHSTYDGWDIYDQKAMWNILRWLGLATEMTIDPENSATNVWKAYWWKPRGGNYDDAGEQAADRMLKQFTENLSEGSRRELIVKISNKRFTLRIETAGEKLQFHGTEDVFHPSDPMNDVHDEFDFTRILTIVRMRKNGNIRLEFLWGGRARAWQIEGYDEACQLLKWLSEEATPVSEALCEATWEPREQRPAVQPVVDDAAEKAAAEKAAAEQAAAEQAAAEQAAAEKAEREKTELQELLKRIGKNKDLSRKGNGSTFDYKYETTPLEEAGEKIPRFRRFILHIVKRQDALQFRVVEELTSQKPGQPGAIIEKNEDVSPRIQTKLTVLEDDNCIALHLETEQSKWRITHHQMKCQLLRWLNEAANIVSEGEKRLNPAIWTPRALSVPVPVFEVQNDKDSAASGTAVAPKAPGSERIRDIVKQFTTLHDGLKDLPNGRKREFIDAESWVSTYTQQASNSNYKIRHEKKVNDWIWYVFPLMQTPESAKAKHIYCKDLNEYQQLFSERAYAQLAVQWMHKIGNAWFSAQSQAYQINAHLLREGKKLVSAVNVRAMVMPHSADWWRIAQFLALLLPVEKLDNSRLEQMSDWYQFSREEMVEGKDGEFITMTIPGENDKLESEIDSRQREGTFRGELWKNESCRENSQLILQAMFALYEMAGFTSSQNLVKWRMESFGASKPLESLTFDDLCEAQKKKVTDYLAGQEVPVARRRVFWNYEIAGPEDFARRCAGGYVNNCVVSFLLYSFAPNIFHRSQDGHDIYMFMPTDVARHVQTYADAIKSPEAQKELLSPRGTTLKSLVRGNQQWDIWETDETGASIQKNWKFNWKEDIVDTKSGNIVREGIFRKRKIVLGIPLNYGGDHFVLWVLTFKGTFGWVMRAECESVELYDSLGTPETPRLHHARDNKTVPDLEEWLEALLGYKVTLPPVTGRCPREQEEVECGIETANNWNVVLEAASQLEGGRKVMLDKDRHNERWERDTLVQFLAEKDPYMREVIRAKMGQTKYDRTMASNPAAGGAAAPAPAPVLVPSQPMPGGAGAPMPPSDRPTQSETHGQVAERRRQQFLGRGRPT